MCQMWTFLQVAGKIPYELVDTSAIICELRGNCNLAISDLKREIISYYS